MKHKIKWRIIAAGIIGNVIEYYDFALIGFLSTTIAVLFFPSDNHFLSLLGSFGAFAAGMIARPVGAMFFGHLGDKINRKYALFASLILMALPTFLIGFLPTYKDIGVLAPILLVVLRLIQGFSVGGEYASSIVYLVEEAPQNRQNLYGSFVSLGAKLGMAIGSGFCGFLLYYYSKDAILEWAWRVPYLVSMVLAVIGFVLRAGLESNYESLKSDKIPLFEIFKNYRNIFWQYLIVASAIWMFYYTIFIYLPVWLESYANIDKTAVSKLNTYSIVLGVIFIPIMAIVADKIGSIKLIKVSALLTTLLITPLFIAMSIGNITLTTIAISIMTILLCAFQAPIFATVVNAISNHHYRASFTAVILGSAAGVVGGATPALMATVAKISGISIAPAFLITIFAAFALRAIFKATSFETQK
ncbi:MAG: MFS transporter [Epsilonproteobacteria bacterium]|nr:MFS transporter [Campylobacterota bacterium]